MKRILMITMLCVMLCGCAACEDKGPRPGEGDLGAVTLVLDWTPNINHTGAYVAQELGYFAEEGLHVNIIQPGDNYALQLVAAGEAEFGFSYQEEVTFARDSGLDVVSLAAVIQHNTSCFAAPKEHNIRSTADFAGKTYGGWGGAVEEALLYTLAEQNSAEPPAIVNIGSADFFSACAGDIDFSWIFYGVTGVEAELRGVELDTIYIRDLAPEFDYYTPVIVSGGEWVAGGQLTAQPDDQVVKAFLRGLSRGYQYADAHPDEAADILLKAAPELDEEMVRAGQQWIAGQYQGDAPYWGWQDINIWQEFGDWMEQRGLLQQAWDGGAAFTNDYLPE